MKNAGPQLHAHCLNTAPNAAYALPARCLAPLASACVLSLHCLTLPCATGALPCAAPRTPMRCLASARASPCALGTIKGTDGPIANVVGRLA